MQALRHIVVGTDFSPCAEAALECAITLANAGLAGITLVHVCELSAELGFDGTPGCDEELIRKCNEQLAAAVVRRARCGVEVKGLLRTGKPWEKLNNAATEVGASLIVIGRVGAADHGGGLARIGAVAKHVLRSATRPVLTVPLNADFARVTSHA
jgi:nucleotide-binding universal stress UspA family protein